MEQCSVGDVCGEADDGAEAVEKVKQLQPDLVILGYQIPVLDGLGVATQIRHLAPETKIILFTIYGSMQMKNYARFFSVDEVVLKSDGAYNLLASIRSIGRR
jgi:DNA-binding NarL/FixJ family response regulator